MITTQQYLELKEIWERITKLYPNPYTEDALHEAVLEYHEKNLKKDDPIAYILSSARFKLKSLAEFKIERVEATGRDLYSDWNELINLNISDSDHHKLTWLYDQIELVCLIENRGELYWDILFCYSHGMSEREASRALKISKTNYNHHLQRIINMLKNRLHTKEDVNTVLQH